MSKKACIAFSDGLRQEMAKFGVRVITVEPGLYKWVIGFKILHGKDEISNCRVQIRTIGFYLYWISHNLSKFIIWYAGLCSLLNTIYVFLSEIIIKQWIWILTHDTKSVQFHAQQKKKKKIKRKKQRNISFVLWCRCLSNVYIASTFIKWKWQL